MVKAEGTLINIFTYFWMYLYGSSKMISEKDHGPNLGD